MYNENFNRFSMIYFFSQNYRMRLSLGLRTYNHANRLGWVGYGAKPTVGVHAGPSDARAFRDISLSEVRCVFD